MRYWDAVFAFLVATAVAALLTPLAGRLARRVGAIAYPSDRGLARKPTPSSAGWRSSLAWCWPLRSGCRTRSRCAHVRARRAGAAGVVHTWTVLAGAGLIALIGAIDDAIDLNPLLKLIGQIGAAIIAAARRRGDQGPDAARSSASSQFPDDGGS